MCLPLRWIGQPLRGFLRERLPRPRPCGVLHQAEKLCSFKHMGHPQSRERPYCSHPKNGTMGEWLDSLSSKLRVFAGLFVCLLARWLACLLACSLLCCGFVRSISRLPGALAPHCASGGWSSDWEGLPQTQELPLGVLRSGRLERLLIARALGPRRAQGRLRARGRWLGRYPWFRTPLVVWSGFGDYSDSPCGLG